MNRRKFLRRMTGATASLMLTLQCSTKRKSQQPNIILFLADDLGYRDLGCYGLEDIRTSTIDRIASQGVKFTSFHANAPEYTPTRTALLTGRYQQRVGGLECAIGVNNVGPCDDAILLSQTYDLGLPISETSVARMLKNVGYNTAMCGKWHLGYEHKFNPNLHGFDYSFYTLGGEMDYFHHCESPPSAMYSLYQNGKPVKRQG